MKSIIYNILCFCLLMFTPSEILAQASGSTEGNAPVFCDAFAAYCKIDVERDIKGGNTNVVNNCIAKIAELYKGSAEEQQFAQRLINDCKDDLGSDFLFANFQYTKKTADFDDNIDDIKSVDRTTSLDEMAVTNNLIKRISASVDSLLRTYSSTMTMEGLKAYFDAIENNQNISMIAEGESEESKKPAEGEEK